MLTCHGCMKRCIQTIIGNSISLSARPSLSSGTPRRPLRRSYASTTSVIDRKAIGHTNSPWTTGRRQPKEPKDTESKDSAERAGYNFTNRTTPPEDRQKWLDSRGVRPAHKKKPLDNGFVVRKHLVYLKDPLKLADFTRDLLRDSGDFQVALKIVQAASKNIQCTVAWNHLIDFTLSQGKMNAAIKLYNEMKKRAQTPDAFTYTIIFRGCATHKDGDQALAKVLAVYQNMLSDKSPIKPNTIHMNAILKMAARANNMEAMFAVADQFPEKGLRAPNNLTFTTILNALRMNATFSKQEDLTPLQKKSNARNAILHARQIWPDVIDRWQRGDVWIDEELVASMGRLLLIGEDQDLDDVMSLIEQTMGIPRQEPRKIVRPRVEEVVARIENSTNPVKELGDLEGEYINKQFDLAMSSTVQPPTSMPPSGISARPQPGPNTLSLLLAALLPLKMKEAATNYWRIFTQDFNVRPDGVNYHDYLRILRVFRSSTETVNVVNSMDVKYLEPKTFRIAMSTCERDKNNHNAFANASKILDLMQNTLKEPVLPVLTSYLEVAMNAKVYSKDDPKHAQGRQIIKALGRLKPFAIDIRNKPLPQSQFSDRRGKRGGEDVDFVLNSRALIRRMISAYDVVISHKMVPEAQILELSKERSRWNATDTQKFHPKVSSIFATSGEGSKEKVERSDPLDSMTKLRMDLKNVIDSDEGKSKRHTKEEEEANRRRAEAFAQREAVAASNIARQVFSSDSLDESQIKTHPKGSPSNPKGRWRKENAPVYSKGAARPTRRDKRALVYGGA